MQADEDQADTTPADGQVGGEGGGGGGGIASEGESPKKPQRETLRNHPKNGLATAEDRLGFKPYVEGLARFLENEETNPPLTVSVEGTWGSGKSSFLLQLKNRLLDGPEESDRSSPEAVTIDFNPWRHRDDESLWAAFALSSLSQLRSKLPWTERILADWSLFSSRMQRKRGPLGAWRIRLTLVGLILLGLGSIIAFVFGVAKAGIALSSLSGGWIDYTLAWASVSAGGAAGAWGLFELGKRLYRRILQPAQHKLQQQISEPVYEGDPSFIERFHQDFSEIIEAYANQDSRVYVFIDDLDRCEVPKAAELMTAINLMLPDSGSSASEDERLVFLLAMDREKIAAGLAVQYEELLPYLYPHSHRKNGGEEGQPLNPHPGIRHGYAFIEKFIHVPFQLPIPQIRNIERLLADMAGREETFPSPVPPGSGRAAQYEIDRGADSPVVKDLATRIAPAFDNNPRRIIQFVNLFRLRVYIGAQTDLFLEGPTPNGHQEAVNLEQLGKFVGLSIGWPRLIKEIAEEPGLLEALEEFAINFRNFERLEGWKQAQEATEEKNLLLQRERYEPWLRDRRLRILLQAGLEERESSEDESGKYSFQGVDVEGLLRVSPPVGLMSESSADQSEESEPGGIGSQAVGDSAIGM